MVLVQPYKTGTKHCLHKQNIGCLLSSHFNLHSLSDFSDLLFGTFTAFNHCDQTQWSKKHSHLELVELSLSSEIFLCSPVGSFFKVVFITADSGLVLLKVELKAACLHLVCMVWRLSLSLPSNWLCRKLNLIHFSTHHSGCLSNWSH